MRYGTVMQYFKDEVPTNAERDRLVRISALSLYS
jgi:hypothetical protein